MDTTNQPGDYSRYIRELSPRQRRAKRIKQDVQKKCQAFASGKSGDNAGTFKDLQGLSRSSFVFSADQKVLAEPSWKYSFYDQNVQRH